MVAATLDAVFEGLDMVFGVATDDSESLLSNIADNAAQSGLQNIETNIIEGIVSLIWSPQTVICDLIAQDTPSAIGIDNTIYCFFNGKTSLREAGTLCYYAYNAGVTSPDMQVPANVTTPGACCSVVFNDQLYLFYEGPGNTGQLWYSAYDGTGWTSGVVPNVSMSQSPSATVFKNDLYVFYQSAAANGTICYSVFNGTTWAAEVSPPIGGISDSPSVVTFTPPGSSTAQLYVFYQGGGNSGGLFYNVFNGSTWTQNTQVPNVGMSSSPSATVFDNQIYVAHQGSGNNEQLWYNAFNGSTWAGDIQAPGALMTGSPATVVYNDQIYVAYSWPDNDALGWGPLFNAGFQGGTVETVGTASSPSTVAFLPGSGTPLPYVFYLCNDQLFYNLAKGPNNWGPPTPVPNLGVSGSASVVLFNNQPYVFYEGGGQLWYSMFNGSSWTSGTISNVTISPSPNAVVFNNQIYVFYQDPGNTGQLWYAVLDGSNWSAGAMVQGVSLSNSASAVVLNNELYVFYQGAGNNGQLWYDVFSGSSWAGPTQVAGVSMSGSPSAAVILNSQTGADQIAVFYEGPDNNGSLCYSVFDGSSWNAQALVPNVEISASPLAVVFTGVLYVFYEGGGDNAGQLWYCMLNGGTWSPEAPVAHISMSGQPSGVVYQPPGFSAGVLYIFHTEASQNGQLWYCSCSSGNWTNGTVSGPGMSCGPAATVFNNDPWVFYQDLEETGTLCYSVAFSKNVWTAGTVPDASMVQSPSAITGTPPGSTTPQIYVFYQGHGSGNGDGLLMCSAYDGNNWTTEQIPGPGMSCGPSAVLYAPAGSTAPSQPYVFYQGESNNGNLCYSMYNGNSWDSGTVPGGVIMSQSPTAMVINDLLYVLYEGPGNDGEMFFISYDGTNWSESTQIGSLQLACSPSLLVLNGRLFCFTQGLGAVAGNSDSGSGALWFTLSNGSYWAWDTKVNNTSMSESPSSVLFNDQAYVFYQGASDNQQLWYSTYDGNWASQTQLIPQGLSNTSSIMSCSPSGVVFTPSGSASPQCYVFYQGPGSNGQLWYNSSADGSNWGAQSQVVPAGFTGSAVMSQSPSAVVFNDQLYVFYEGGGNDLQIWYTSSSDGNSWSTQAQLPGITKYCPSASPFAVVFDNKLYVFYNYMYEASPGDNPIGTLYYSVFDGIGWTAPATPGVTNPANDSSANMYQSPAAVVFEDQLYVYFQSEQANGNLWYTVFDGTNWSTIATAGSLTMITGLTGANLAKVITTEQSAFMNFWGDLDDD